MIRRQAKGSHKSSRQDEHQKWGVWGDCYAASGTRQARAVISSNVRGSALYSRYEGIAVSLSSPRALQALRGTFFKGAPCKVRLFHLVPRVLRNKQRVNEDAGCFTKRETVLCLSLIHISEPTRPY